MRNSGLFHRSCNDPKNTDCLWPVYRDCNKAMKILSETQKKTDNNPAIARKLAEMDNHSFADSAETCGG